MFIENKYHKLYFLIIRRAQTRLVDNSCYYEKHHIIPKSLGGNNKKENLVLLTAREHFICHWLLTKCVSDRVEKMNYALWKMMNSSNEYQERYKVTSKKYEILKKKLSKVFSKQHKGRIFTEEQRKKMSETRKKLIAEGKLKVNENKEKYKKIAEDRKGKKLSKSTCEKISKAHTGKVLSQEHKNKLSKINIGNFWSEEKRNKLRETLKKQYASGERVPKKGPRKKLLEVS